MSVRYRVRLWDERRARERVLRWPAPDAATARAQVTAWLGPRHWLRLLAIDPA